MATPHDVILFRLEDEGTCGVGDHARGFVRNLGGRIVDVARGDLPVRGDRGLPGRAEPGARGGAARRDARDTTAELVAWEPTGWVAEIGWVGTLADRLDPARDARRTLFIHELERPVGFTPRAFARWAVDRVGFVRVLRRARRVVVTTAWRAGIVRDLAAAAGATCDVHVLGVASNVHAHDPSPGARAAPTSPRLAVFAPGSDPTSTLDAVADAVAAVVRRAPEIPLVVLGRRKATGDPLTARLAARLGPDGLRRVEITGALAAGDLVRHLDACAAGLAIGGTGISGRRGTIAAYLAAGLPIVGNAGFDTDPIYRASAAIRLATETTPFDAVAVARAIVDTCALGADAWRGRSAAARDLYLAHHAWSALADRLAGGAIDEAASFPSFHRVRPPLARA